jgi:hypothetical protein
MAEDINRAFPQVIKYEAMSRTNVSYDAKYWDRLKAFYAGGKDLLKSRCFGEIFPRHLNERYEVYSERTARAFYINYAGEIIDHIVSALLMHPVQITSDAKADEFYKDFAADVSFGGGRVLSIHQLVRQQILTALICKRAWTLVDFPPVIEALGEDLTAADQEKLGALDAYAIPLDPEMVLDWEETADGALIWAKTCVDRVERSFDMVDNMVRSEYTIYRPADWARYSITWDPTKGEPKPTDEVSLIDQGVHSFGKVPLLRLELPDGLWAMNKLESMCREYLNKRCALSWAEFKTLYQQLYEFEGEGGECLEGEGAGNDPNRFTNQTRGPGYVQVRGPGDRAEFVGPSSEPFAHALNSLKDLRDEMHRVTHQMALSFDNHALALRRSGESKHQDKKDATVILDALGQLARDHVKDIFQTVAAGRGDVVFFNVGGLDEYDSVDVAGSIDEATKIQTLVLPSQTFKSEYAYSLVKTVLGEKVSTDTLEKIKTELESGFEEVKAQEEQLMETSTAQSESGTDEENENGNERTEPGTTGDE